MCVFRSLNHIYTQVIDDTAGHTLAAASTLDREISEDMNGKDKKGKSELVGALIARRAMAKGVEQVAFDRGGQAVGVSTGRRRAVSGYDCQLFVCLQAAEPGEHHQGAS